MTKYRVYMNYVTAHRAEFVVEAKDSDELHDLIGELDLDFLENNAGFKVCDYEPPVIDEWEKVNKNMPVDEIMQRAIDEVKNAWEAL